MTVCQVGTMSQDRFLSNSTNFITHEEAVAVVSQIFDAKNLDVVDFWVENFSSEILGYICEHKLLVICVQRKGNNRESTINCIFFLKSTTPNCSHFNKRLIQEECEFFDKAVPLLRDFQMDPWAPTCYLTNSKVLILEDLKLQGFQCATEKFTVDQLKAAIAAIARFHAFSMILEFRLKKPLKHAFSGSFNEKILTKEQTPLRQFVTVGMEVAESVAGDLGLDPQYVSMAYEYVLQENHTTDTEWNVLCHRDLWMNNLMFSKDDKCCRLIDFQMVAYASFAIDVLQLLYANVDKVMKQKFEQHSLKLYHSVLSETLINNGISNDRIISLEKVLEVVEKQRIYGLFYAVHSDPILFLNKQLQQDFTKDPALTEYYMYVSRKDFVKKAMQIDDAHRDRVEIAVKELVNYMKLLHNK